MIGLLAGLCTNLSSTSETEFRLTDDSDISLFNPDWKFIYSFEESIFISWTLNVYFGWTIGGNEDSLGLTIGGNEDSFSLTVTSNEVSLGFYSLSFSSLYIYFISCFPFHLWNQSEIMATASFFVSLFGFIDLALFKKDFTKAVFLFL